MSGKEPTPDVETLAVRMNDGIKSCQSMVSNYRALLEADHKDLEPPPEADHKDLEPPPEADEPGGTKA